jgi:hypothetical protein
MGLAVRVTQGVGDTGARCPDRPGPRTLEHHRTCRIPGVGQDERACVLVQAPQRAGLACR